MHFKNLQNSRYQSLKRSLNLIENDSNENDLWLAFVNKDVLGGVLINKVLSNKLINKLFKLKVAILFRGHRFQISSEMT